MTTLPMTITAMPKVAVRGAREDDQMMIALFVERAPMRSAGTARVYRQAVQRFLAWHGGRLAEVQFRDVQAYQTLPAEHGGLRGLAPATQARHVATLKALFRLAVEIGYLASDPTRLALLPKVHHKPQAWVTGAEMLQLINAGRKALENARGRWERTQARRNVALIALAVTTGCRAAELAGLEWDDLYQDPNGRLGARIRGKGGKAREVRLLPAAWTALVAYRQGLGLPDRRTGRDRAGVREPRRWPAVGTRCLPSDP